MNIDFEKVGTAYRNGEINPTLKQDILDYIEINYPQYNNNTYLIKLNF